MKRAPFLASAGLVLAAWAGLASTALASTGLVWAQPKAMPQPGHPVPCLPGWGALSQEEPLAGEANFEAYFPDDRAGGRALDMLWTRRNSRTPSATRDLPIIRNGLRHTTVPRASILRWLGNKFIWEKNPQNAAAIEIMFHAADPRNTADRYGTRHNAVYYGLSVVKPKPDRILTALASLCMEIDEAETIARAVWGCRDQRPALLGALAPFLESKDPKRVQKAKDLQSIVRGELSAFDWAKQHAEREANRAFQDVVPTWQASLLAGPSSERQKTLGVIQAKQAVEALPLAFLPALEACLADPEPKVRELAAGLIGRRWCGRRKVTPPAAEQALLRATRDTHPSVRYAAVALGLSQVDKPSDGIILRLLELARNQPSADMSSRIRSSLMYCRPQALRLLEDWIRGDDYERAHWAYAYFERFANRPSTVRPKDPVQPADLAGRWLVELSLGPGGPVVSDRLTFQTQPDPKGPTKLAGTLGKALLENIAWARDGARLQFAFDAEVQGGRQSFSATWDGKQLRGTCHCARGKCVVALDRPARALGTCGPQAEPVEVTRPIGALPERESAEDHTQKGRKST